MVRRILRAYLSLTRGERNGFFVLAILLIFLGLARLLIPVLIRPPVPDFTEAESAFLAFRSALSETAAVAPPGDGIPERKAGHHRPPARNLSPPFDFDPNEVPYEDLLELGLSETVARTLVNYRNSGGEFNSKRDLMKIYGLDRKDYLRLEPYISIPPVPAVPVKHTTSFELNAADTSRLQLIYGIGPVFAARIVRYRDLLGGFCRTDQLKEVYGLSGQQYDEILKLTFVDTGLLQKIDLNFADRKTLARHPYLTPYQADALLAFREFSGGWKNLNEIPANGLLPDSVYRRILPYLKIGN